VQGLPFKKVALRFILDGKCDENDFFCQPLFPPKAIVLTHPPRREFTAQGAARFDITSVG
jgi:hypothetical protein